MYNHEPDGYSCPFCRRTSLDMGLGSSIQHSDIVFDNGTVTAFLAAIQRNPNDGSVLVIPNNHYENIYDMPVGLLAQIHELSRRIAIAQKNVYACHGVSLRQHNEPAGSQDVWHYHLQVTPRYQGDNFYVDYENGKRVMPAEERAGHAKHLREQLSNWRSTLAERLA
jgi:histidine triad (HIT) family protein